MVAADLAVPEAPEDLAAAALQVFGGLDVLINNAGISHPELVVDLSADLLDDVITVNLRAPSLLGARIGREMAAAGSGRIPLRRFAYPAEVSATAVWLASDASSMINGVDLPIDGGYLIS